MVGAVAVGLELAYGANAGEVLLYLGYEVVFVVAPGWLAYRALSSHPGGGLRQLAIGWALGYAIEILAFMLTAATDTRGLFILYPLIVGGLAITVILGRAPVPTPETVASPDHDANMAGGGGVRPRPGLRSARLFRVSSAGNRARPVLPGLSDDDIDRRRGEEPLADRGYRMCPGSRFRTTTSPTSISPRRAR